MASHIIGYPDKQKAIDIAVWMNFKNRNSNRHYGVIEGAESSWFVLDEEESDEKKMPFLDILPESYAEMSYDHIELICSDVAPLLLWEEIAGNFATLDTDVLLFILHLKIPLERFIRYELACQGFDENDQWCGFDKANEIWLK